MHYSCGGCNNRMPAGRGGMKEECGGWGDVGGLKTTRPPRLNEVDDARSSRRRRINDSGLPNVRNNRNWASKAAVLGI